MEVNRDHDVISYLHHTVVTMAEPASPPSLNSLPNFAVNKSRTVQELQEQQVWIYWMPCFRTYCVQLIQTLSAFKKTFGKSTKKYSD